MSERARTHSVRPTALRRNAECAEPGTAALGPPPPPTCSKTLRAGLLAPCPSPSASELPSLLYLRGGEAGRAHGPHPCWGHVSGSEEHRPVGHHQGGGVLMGAVPHSRLLSEPWTPSSCCWNRPREGRLGEAFHSQEPSAGVTLSQEGEAARRGCTGARPSPILRGPESHHPGAGAARRRQRVWGTPAVSLPVSNSRCAGPAGPCLPYPHSPLAPSAPTCWGGRPWDP